MKRRLAEETVIFISVLKWVALSVAVGAMVGLSTTAFLKALSWGSAFSSRYSYYFFGNNSYYFFLLPVALFLSTLMTKYLAPDAEGHGTDKIIEAVHKRSGKIKALVVPVKLVATIVTLVTGGSAGKEGPCAQIGAGLASVFADVLRVDDQDRKKLVICGISAGFASVFGTPIAGAIFGLEVLFVGNVLYDVLLPSFVAGITGYRVAWVLGGRHFHYTMNFVPVFNESLFLKIILAGIFFGMCSFFLIEVLKIGGKLSKKIQIWTPLKGIIGGTVLIILTLVFSNKYLGLGMDTIKSSLRGGKVPWYAFILKTIFTSITLNFGGSGGIVTPIFFIGVTSGILFADIFGLDRATFSAIGLVSLLAGAANTPIAASIMAVELFGPKLGPYAAVSCIISFLMTGHRSVYPSQIMDFKKSSSIHIEGGEEVEDVKAHFKPRSKSLIGIGLWIGKTIKEKLNKKKT
ncbi:MAG: chloride channel protein [Candidatus Brocadiales bacterium]|nr:chloride channel protein [Candidatus Brocadiales bacterium]